MLYIVCISIKSQQQQHILYNLKLFCHYSSLLKNPLDSRLFTGPVNFTER